MSHMEHFRDAKVFDGEQLLLEGVEGHLAYRDKPGGRREWFGYFEVAEDKHIEAASHYRLVLADGRTAEINASDIRGCSDPGKHTHPVQFYVSGEIRGGRRSLEKAGNRLSH